MRVGPQPIIARPAWYDRNPSTIIYTFCDTLSPHAPTPRFNYVVPSGKKAMVEVMLAKVVRVSSATTPGWATAQIAITPYGGSMAWVCIARLTDAHNAAKDMDSMSIGGSIMLFPGDAVTGLTADLSTGGTCHYILAVKLTLFDA